MDAAQRLAELGLSLPARYTPADSYVGCQVIDGCSKLFVDVFGDRGRHARSSVGVARLPFGIPVEIELVARVRD
jgi:enamine deaminase RidA (YjgF/YER057c/UK114 family)